MTNAKIAGYALLGVLVAAAIAFVPGTNVSAPAQTATVGEAKTVAQILQKRANFTHRAQARNAQRLINVLIVPGHDDEYWGTQHGKLKEVQLNRQLAENLYGYLVKEEGINPVLASDSNGYNPIFEEYFAHERSAIEEFISQSKTKFQERLQREGVELAENDFHNPAPGDTAVRLYGINRWVNEADFDLVVHIHFNDYRGRGRNKVGKYEGFSIYTPGKEFENYELSRELADSIFAEMKKVRPISNLEAEEGGVIEDHELIAVGANESLRAGSVLVEYGYIYENIFADPELRDVSLDHMAYATYAGIKKLLGEEPAQKEAGQLAVTKGKVTPANLAWQFIKAYSGQYPPPGKTMEDCPVTGYYGECSARVK